MRFITFSGIGASVFVAGLGVQAFLTGRLHLAPELSYGIQAVISIESNFLLNRWLTWRDRGTPFWAASIRFNAQRAVTVGLNLAFYYELIRLGVNYLVANALLVATFTILNYMIGDRFVFTPRTPRWNGAASLSVDREAISPVASETLTPQVSVVIPCRSSECTIGPAVQSLINQDYPELAEIILIGSPGDSTWTGLAGIDDPRLATIELEAPPGVRDANFKRDYGIRCSSGDLIALVDSDIVLPSDWLTTARAALDNTGVSCVTGSLRSIRADFWGRYTDSTLVGAKTPRVTQSYGVSRDTFGLSGFKPPISANILFQRDLYESCQIDPYWSYGSYEDYEWFWRVVRSGHEVRVCRELFGWHHHRQGIRALAREYLRSARGCAYFIRAHGECPLARRRLLQAIVLPLGAAAFSTSLAIGADSYRAIGAAVLLIWAALLCVCQVAFSRRLEGIGYVAAGTALGTVFIVGLLTYLVRAWISQSRVEPARRSPSPVEEPGVLVLQPRAPLPYRLAVAAPSRASHAAADGRISQEAAPA